MATSKSLKTVKQAEPEAHDVKTVKQQSIGDWREQQAAADLPTSTRRLHPPTDG